MRKMMWMALAVTAGGLCAVPFGARALKAERGAVAPQEAAVERAREGIGRIERTAVESGMTAESAAAFRSQMARRLAASGADRKTVETWAGAESQRRASSASRDVHVAAPDYSALTAEEREHFSMSANYINATRTNTHQ